MTDRDGLRFRYVETNGVRLHLAESGSADAPPVLLLHGFPEFWRGWRHQLTGLAAGGRRVLAPDQRGYNLSDKPKRVASYGLDSLAADVIGLLDDQGLASAPIVGHDWGGLVAWWVAATYPERVSSLIVLNAPHPLVMRRSLRRDAAQRRRSWYIFFFQLPWLPEAWYGARDCSVGVRSLAGTARRGTFKRQDLEAYKQAWRQPRALTTMIHWYRAALRHPPKRRAQQITAPTLLLWGERDRFLGQELARPSLDLCRDGRLRGFPEATHWLQHEESQEVNRAILDHLG